ncbi:hypothetical protein PVK06_027918 [Gossypium arboreum]|uniref:Uncharacterized protein n=1 Tax=Gossypium arboreum TaxID=29729 RepID=A0ABR0P1K0_GOSAR|nr:hypothetical protein PVK06_027918 [Gossypium arboreum]
MDGPQQRHSLTCLRGSHHQPKRVTMMMRKMRTKWRTSLSHHRTMSRNPTNFVDTKIVSQN